MGVNPQLTNCIIAMAPPIALIAIAGVTNKLIRGKKWRFADFFLGREIALATLAAEVLHIFNLVRAMVGSDTNEAKTVATSFGWNFVYFLLTLFVFLLIVGLHQDWQAARANPTRRDVILGLGANALATAVFVVFAVFVGRVGR